MTTDPAGSAGSPSSVVLRIHPFMSARPVKSNIRFHLPQPVTKLRGQLVVFLLDRLPKLLTQTVAFHGGRVLHDERARKFPRVPGPGGHLRNNGTDIFLERLEALRTAQLSLLAELRDL